MWSYVTFMSGSGSFPPAPRLCWSFYPISKGGGSTECFCLLRYYSAKYELILMVIFLIRRSYFRGGPIEILSNYYMWFDKLFLFDSKFLQIRSIYLPKLEENILHLKFFK